MHPCDDGGACFDVVSFYVPSTRQHEHHALTTTGQQLAVNTIGHINSHHRITESYSATSQAGSLSSHGKRSQHLAHT